MIRLGWDVSQILAMCERWFLKNRLLDIAAIVLRAAINTVNEVVDGELTHVLLLEANMTLTVISKDQANAVFG